MGRLIIEADGVLMETLDINKPFEFIKEDYFLLRTPEWKVLSALKRVLKKMPDAPVLIVVKIPYEMPDATIEIKKWFKTYLPCFDNVKILPYGEYVGSYMALLNDDVLISSSERDIALFLLNNMSAIGVDIDTDCLKGIGYFSTYSNEDDIYQYLKELLTYIKEGVING